jgi:tuberous sclerosis 2
MDGNLSVCVQAFTVLLMERCDIFERQLADIVLAVSKISDTMHVAIPILEFMSTITHLPYSLTNWNQKQFSYVFATCLPYTSPARYDHYVVCRLLLTDSIILLISFICTGFTCSSHHC